MFAGGKGGLGVGGSSSNLSVKGGSIPVYAFHSSYSDQHWHQPPGSFSAMISLGTKNVQVVSSNSSNEYSSGVV